MSPHENFKAGLTAMIGLNIDNIPPYRWRLREEALIEAKTLQNGNEERTYKYLRSCKLIFEINPITRVITGTRFEGAQSDCVINP